MSIIVSIIIPTYNRARCVTEAIESVLSQTYHNYEIIVIDDGSTDDTQRVLMPYIENGKIEYIYQENAGVSAARNAGMKIARGEWIACLDSDDCWLPNKLERQMKIIDKSAIELGCVICNMQFDRPVGRYSCTFESALFNPMHPQGICRNMASILLTRFVMFNQGAIIKKVYLDEIGGFDERLDVLEDYDLALKLSFLCVWAYDASPLVIYRRDYENSISSKVCLSYQSKQISYIYQNLKIFLHDKGILVPKLLNKRINYYTHLQKYQHMISARIVFKIYRFLMRRLPCYPRPKTEKIEI